MNTHLSPHQFAKCAAYGPASVELKHLENCEQCSAELQRFTAAVLHFRNGLRARIDDRLSSATVALPYLRNSADAAGLPNWRWALAAAALLLVLLPIVRNENGAGIVSEPAASEINADAVIDVMNRHLSRVLPTPLEPMMSLVPNNELIIDSKGMQ